MRLADWSDMDILRALDWIDHEGLTRAQVGARIGRPKNSVIGAVGRIVTDANKSDPDGNQNGTMPRGWWIKGAMARPKTTGGSSR